ncbi:sulfatase family protein [Roseimaritima sediminicola]|uniref:sulfatase family protein n=1 Tax=Roseimaritima sediminicola TaxID=2662066 RepID=UPI0012984876|nr:arylsulfatase [Roseimaritima sediminicola]
MNRLLVHVFAVWLAAGTLQAADRPSVVFILADDMGYGEIEALNPDRSAIPTPSLNSLAEQGRVFTDAHTTSSVCTPTRYSLLTGRYNWRTRLQRGVMVGDGDPLIAADRLTLGHLFQRQGYHTATIGKWHLNYNYQRPDASTAKGKRSRDGKAAQKRRLAAAPIGTIIPDGPMTRGFDSFYGFHHARSMGSIVRDDKIVDEVDPREVLPLLVEEATRYIDERAAASKNGQPFLLYLPLSSPHTPIVPAEDWQGRTELGDYGDFVAQTDGAVGAVIEALERNGLAEDTILFFAADNGTSKAAGIDRLQRQGHYPSGDLRGSKADLWEGGHRVPFLVRWPQRIEAGSQCDQLICLVDMMATFAEFFDVALPDDAAEDSISFLPALLSQPQAKPRETLVHHSVTGQFAIRHDNWKLLLAPGSGGWTSPKGRAAIRAGLPEMQLYDLAEDLGEQKNLVDAHPQRAERMIERLQQVVAEGRSTPGQPQKNDAEIDLWKRQLWK